MSGHRAYKLVLVGVAVLCLVAAGQFQSALNRQRSNPALGLNRVADLGSNAPPVLAFTTVALGGFRGLIANVLWIRANELQNDGKYFEAVQLADWITKLEPTFTQVWLFQGWNMAYNISVKFSDLNDRWRWVQRGIELLRDQGLRYNPKDALMYRELGWFFQHKVGQNMDDAHRVYKAEWAKEMTALFGGTRPNFNELLDPKTPQAKQRVELVREKYKMDPVIMKEVDDTYGPLEWRLPEAHAIYWATVGLKNSKKKNLITLRRVIYQSMLANVLRGRILYVQSDGDLVTGPNLDLAQKAEATYERLAKEETEMPFAVETAQKSFLREIVYHFYTYNRMAEANHYFDLLRSAFPDAVPPNTTMQDFALRRLNDNISDMPFDRMRILLAGIIYQHFLSLALDDDARAAGFEKMAREIYNLHQARVSTRHDPLTLPPYDDFKQAILKDVLDPERGMLTPELILRLRTKLGLPAPAAKPEIKQSSGSSRGSE